MASTSTFASTVGLIKDSVRNKFFHKEHRAPAVTEQEVKTARKPQQLPKYDCEYIQPGPQREIGTDQIVNIARRETTAAFEYLASVK